MLNKCTKHEEPAVEILYILLLDNLLIFAATSFVLRGVAGFYAVELSQPAFF